MPGETATKNLNVFILGLAFLGLFTAFNTMGNIQQTILDSAVNEDLDEESGYVEGKWDWERFIGEWRVNPIFDRVFGHRLLFLGHHLRRLCGVQLVRALRHGRFGAEGHHVLGRRHIPRPGGLFLLPQRLPLLLRVRVARSGGRNIVDGASKLQPEKK